MSRDYVKSIRLAELESIFDEIDNLKLAHCKILEIGAGSGWQANQLAIRGHSVEAIDVEESIYNTSREWLVNTYDGRHIPYDSEVFDIVFSSNVLEHISHIHEFQSEIQRVLKPNGVAIHILPSGSWRFWTNITHYPLIIKTAIKAIYIRFTHRSSATQEYLNSENREFNKSRILHTLIKASFPERHGEIGNAISEIYYFRKQRWLTLFNNTGWNIVKIYPNKLFYTGHIILGSSLSLYKRRALSSVLGSSCNVFVLSKSSNSDPRVHM